LYSLALPLLLLDVWVTICQAVLFPLLRVAPVVRRDYLVFDRHRLPYLNLIQRLNCLYCGYANGVLAYVREVAARLEQYWCAVQHRRQPRDPHARYAAFAAYGDARGLQEGASRLRRALRPGRPPRPAGRLGRRLR
jgi:hypothetical protein